jgi:hypothetical protein
MKGWLTLILLSFLVISLRGQLSSSALGGAQLNTIHTSVPFLTIAPDARASGMGDVGAASQADVNSQHWNVAKYAFAEGTGALSFTYTPWLKSLIPDIVLGYASGYYKIDSKNILSSSIRYFSLGEIIFTSLTGTVTGSYRPFEFAVDAGYTRRFNDNFSGGMVLRYIHSDLTSGQLTPGGDETHPGTSMAADLGFYYQDQVMNGEKGKIWALGVSLSNMGPGISYTADAENTPIPTNLRLGGRIQFLINEDHSFSVQGDVNKLLVPTPPMYDTDTATGSLIIIRGKAPPTSFLAGMIQSFYDAPGVQMEDGSFSVLREELHEIQYSIGMEYSFRKLLSLRMGYHSEHASKGNRKYYTLGAGVHYHLFSLDLSRLISSNNQQSPLSNTWRVMLTCEFGKS